MELAEDPEFELVRCLATKVSAGAFLSKMYKIKEKPEDFVVKEISNTVVGDKGDYCYVLLKKRNYTTERSVQLIASKLGLPRKFLGYAGNKDKKAVTEKMISIKKCNAEKVMGVVFKDIELEFKGRGNEPISLGDLEGNSFEIAVRDLSDKELCYFDKKKKSKKMSVPNLYGEQRFSKNNVEIGIKILKKDFKGAVDLILRFDDENREMVGKYLDDKKNDYIGALRLIPKKILLMYVHSVQSFIFNECVKEYLKKGENVKKIPLFGFGFECEDDVLRNIIENIAEKMGLDERDFVIREIPEISAEGGERDLFALVDGFDYTVDGDSIILRFILGKGSYATVVVEHLFQPM